MTDKFSHLKHRDRRTTEEISALICVPVGTLNKIFSGQTRNPSFQTMDQLCRLFHVSIHYLLDDDVPVECSLNIWDGATEVLPVSSNELDLLAHYRQLDPRDKRSMESVLRLFTLHTLHISAQPAARAERLLPCYDSAAPGQVGVALSGLRVRLIQVPINSVTQAANWAVTVFTDELHPFHRRGDILAVASGQCPDNALGVFLLNGEGLIRKLCRRKNEFKLAALTTQNSCIRIEQGDCLDCVGQVVGAIPDYCYVE